MINTEKWINQPVCQPINNDFLSPTYQPCNQIRPLDGSTNIRHCSEV